MLELRNASLSDYELFKRLHDENFACEAFTEKQKEMVSRRAFEELVEDETIFFLTDGMTNFGYAWLIGYDDGFCKIREICIEVAYRRNGIGRKFVELLRELASNIGFENMEIFSMNMETDIFWLKCGFKPKNNTERMIFKL